MFGDALPRLVIGGKRLVPTAKAAGARDQRRDVGRHILGFLQPVRQEPAADEQAGQEIMGLAQPGVDQPCRGKSDDRLGQARIERLLMEELIKMNDELKRSEEHTSELQSLMRSS